MWHLEGSNKGNLLAGALCITLLPTTVPYEFILIEI